MSTRAVVRIYNEKDKEICTLYKQNDGYPENMKPLLKQFQIVKVTNGRKGDHWEFANGMGDLATEIIVKLKSDSRDIAIIDSEEWAMQEWEYLFKFDGIDKPPLLQIIKK